MLVALLGVHRPEPPAVGVAESLNLGRMGSGFFRGRSAGLALTLAAVGICLLLGGSIAAQEGRPEVRMTVEGGIEGWVDPRWPMTLTARIHSDLLLVGELLVVQGQELARVAVEVPAGGARTYQVVVAPHTGQGAVLLRLVPEGAPDDEPVASAFFRPRVASDEILVGLVDLSGLEPVLGEVRSAVSGEPVTPVGIEDSSMRLETGEFHPLSYLVLDRPRPLPPPTVAWLKGGGRLVTTSAALDSMDLDAVPWGSFPGVEGSVGWYGVGEGEVVALDTLLGHDPQLWARLLRPLPLPTDRQDGFQEGSGSAIQTALAVETQTPSYPWLPLVVVAYALVVGPLNLWILRRRRRLEWAWFTIPVFGLIGVVVFWIVGTGGVNQAFWSHGTVQVAGPSAQTRSGVVVASSRARTLEVSLDSDWVGFPESPDRITGGSVQPTIRGENVYQYDLPPLGWLALNVFRREEPLGLAVAFSEGGLELRNDSSIPVSMWGVYAYPKVAVGGRLDPGAADSMSWSGILESESHWSFRDAFWDFDAATDAGDRNWPEMIGNLGNLAQRSGMMDVPFFVFAVVEESITHLEVDGRASAIPGLKLILFPISSERMGERGWAFARTVGVDDVVGDADLDGGAVFAEHWILSYRAPVGLAAPPRLVLGGLDPDFDRPPGRFDDQEESENGQGWAAWDWEVSEFVSIDPDLTIDPRRFVAPSGEVLMRVSSADLLRPAPLAGVLMWGDMP